MLLLQIIKPAIIISLIILGGILWSKISNWLERFYLKEKPQQKIGRKTLLFTIIGIIWYLVLSIKGWVTASPIGVFLFLIVITYAAFYIFSFIGGTK